MARSLPVRPLTGDSHLINLTIQREGDSAPGRPSVISWMGVWYGRAAARAPLPPHSRRCVAPRQPAGGRSPFAHRRHTGSTVRRQGEGPRTGRGRGELFPQENLPCPGGGPSMVGQYFVGRGSKRAGPFSAAQLRVLAADGRLQLTDTVWTEGMEAPVLARRVNNLFPAPRAPAPSAGIVAPAETGPPRPRPRPAARPPRSRRRRSRRNRSPHRQSARHPRASPSRKGRPPTPARRLRTRPRRSLPDTRPRRRGSRNSPGSAGRSR